MRVSEARRLLTFVLPATLIPALVISASASAGEPEVALGADMDPLIYGGTAVQTCGWPTAVYLSFGGAACSGTLVHPEIVVTAAHCPNSTTGRSANVSFGEGFGGGARTVGATCYSNPSWTGAVGGQDYGYCKLNSPVNDVPIIPPAWGCDTSALTNGREVVIVGFGQSDNGGSGSKREVTTQITAIGEQAVIGGNGKDACQGDSGGPVYIQLKPEFGGDGSWRVFGITSGGSACGNGGIFALMHVAIPWIETHSGIDITPCQDSEGTWAPTPLCGSIPLDPARGNGASWQSGCTGGPVSGFSALCGDAFGTGEDTDPPSVAITSPSSGTELSIPAGASTVSVSVSATADDGDGFGVADVRLVINGQSFSGDTDSTAPYTWDLVFGPGGYLIEAIATDYVGNESTPDVIAVGVDQPAPSVPEPGGDDGGSGDGGSGDGGSGDGGSGDGGPIGTTGDELGATEGGSGCAVAEPAPLGLLGGLLGLFGLVAGGRSRRRVRA
jgi:hypothetical protein